MSLRRRRTMTRSGPRSPPRPRSRTGSTPSSSGTGWSGCRRCATPCSART